MESRKVQRVGYSTLSVSLPKDWVKETDLKQGDIVMFLPEKDGSLRLMPSALVERKAKVEEFVVNADLCDEPGMLERVVIGNYVLGRDIIRIVSSNRILSTHIKEVRRIIRRLIGLGMVEETPNQIVLQCSIDPMKFHFATLLRRLSIIAATMLSEALQALVESNPELARDAIRREDEADKVYWLALRLLLSAQQARTIAEKIGLEEPLHIVGNRAILKYLELIADYAEYIASAAVQLEKYKGKISKQAIEKISHIGELTHGTFQKAVDCVFTGDIRIANSVLEVRKLIKMEQEGLVRGLPEVPHLRCLAISIIRIADIGADIAAIAVNRTLEKPSKICSPRSV